MSRADFDLSQGSLRATDSNSLLRLYDRVLELARCSSSQQERTRADKAKERIAQELEKRKIVL